MTKNLIQKTFPFIAMLLVIFCFTNCSSDVDMKKQQAAFHVDADGNLLNKKGELVKSKGEFKLEGGYYVDSDGNTIKRNIDKTKDKINKTVDNTKEAMGTAASNTKEAMSNAADKTKTAVTNAADKTVESVKANFKELFNTKAYGTVYELPEITFEKDSHRINGMSKADVEGLAAALKEHPEARIQVQVHTADGKNNTENKKLSGLRADVVKNMMVALGVSEDQISAKGLGLTSVDAAKAVANKVEVVVEK